MKCSVAVCNGREDFCHCRRLLFKQSFFSPSCADCLVLSVPFANRCRRWSQGLWPAEHGLGSTCIQLRRGSNQGASTHTSLFSANKLPASCTSVTGNCRLRRFTRASGGFRVFSQSVMRRLSTMLPGLSAPQCLGPAADHVTVHLLAPSVTGGCCKSNAKQRGPSCPAICGHRMSSTDTVCSKIRVLVQMGSAATLA